MVDASDIAVGVVLHQYIEGERFPVTFFHRKPKLGTMAPSAESDWRYTWPSGTFRHFFGGTTVPRLYIIIMSS